MYECTVRYRIKTFHHVPLRNRRRHFDCFRSYWIACEHTNAQTNTQKIEWLIRVVAVSSEKRLCSQMRQSGWLEWHGAVWRLERLAKLFSGLCVVRGRVGDECGDKSLNVYCRYDGSMDFHILLSGWSASCCVVCTLSRPTTCRY